MRNDPFTIKETGDISDSFVGGLSGEVDGDIIIADSYRKRIKYEWKRTAGVRVMFFAILALFALLFGKLYYLQVVRGAEYYGAAEGNRIRGIALIPPRGVIFDKQGERLAYNVPDFALAVIPADLPQNQDDEDEIFINVADILGMSHYDLVESFAHIDRDSFERVELARGISQEKAIMLSRDIEKWGGVFLVPVQQRTYPVKEALSHVLGYTGKISKDDMGLFSDKGYVLIEHVGKTGIEKEYQDVLRGKPGVALMEVDSGGKQIRELESRDPVIGDNIYLNLDLKLQNASWEFLKEMIYKMESPGGSVIVLNPNDGAVMALVSFPGFDNELIASGISSSEYEALLGDKREPLFSRAISGEYPSGSTIKLVVGTAALEEGIITRYTSVMSTGGIDVNGYWFPDWKYGGHGQTNIIHALAESVNTFFYAVGGGYQNINGLGVDRIAAYGRLFGLYSETGIDLPSERGGFLPSKEWKEQSKGEQWYLGDTYHLAIGQGDILVTPLQVANFTAAIANNGTLYVPRLVGSIGREPKSARPVRPRAIREKIASRSNIEIIQQALRAAVTYGTVRSLNDLPVAVAGKTGTAQFSKHEKPHAWFTGYAPYDNPEIVVTVLVEEGEGGDISATPIAKKIFEWYFSERD